MGDAVTVWLVITAVGIAAQPIAQALFAPLPGSAAGLARPLGLLLCALPLWLASSLGLVPYGAGSALAFVALLAVAGAVVWWRTRPALDWTSLAVAEAVFTFSFVLGVLYVAQAPDVWGTERPTDMAFLTAVQNTEHFPPLDPWLAGEDLNYYYLGQYLMAFVLKAAGAGPTEGYNAAVALVWALGAGAAFGLGRAARGIGAGLLVALFAVWSGNLAGAVDLLQHSGPLLQFNWFEAARVVAPLGNDFPVFELIIGDLHAHVISGPFLLLVGVMALRALRCGPVLDWRVVPAGISVGALYAISAWALPAGAGLLFAAAAMRDRDPGRLARFVAAVSGVALLFFAPFVLGFEPGGVRGVEVVTDRPGLIGYAEDLGGLYGLALIPALLVLAWRWWPAALVAVAIGFLLGGPAGLAVLAVAAGVLAVKREEETDRFALLLLCGGLVSILIPAVLNVRDAFEGGEAERFNTAIKFSWNAWLLLGAAAGILIALGSWKRWAPVVALVAVAGAAHPIAAAYVRSGGWEGPGTLNGERFLPPGDRAAIAWIRANTPGDAVVLEAEGPEYSPQYHARISVFTGRPTILGWAGHELFYGKPERLGTRSQDIRTIYQSGDRALLERYGVDYVVIGELERTTYPPVQEAAFGRPVFTRDGTAVYRVG